ncbi:MAG TPA: NAD(P)H-binding protein, partial [Blastocatellia bacterium]|nr:NAD(P)H-binding protein [Blastocatellia bacterium]
MSNEKNTILVTGATGNVGRQVVSQLLATGARVRALTRNPASAALPGEVDVVRGDLLDPNALYARLGGVEAVFLVWRSLADDAAPFLNAVATRARRIVFLSSAAVRDDVEQQTNPIGKAHAEIEGLIEKSGLEWTFLRPGGFATNALWWWAPQIRMSDVVRWPYGAAAWAPIHERDIAAVAVRALTEKGHGGAKYFLTGGQSL